MARQHLCIFHVRPVGIFCECNGAYWKNGHADHNFYGCIFCLVPVSELGPEAVCYYQQVIEAALRTVLPRANNQ